MGIKCRLCHTVTYFSASVSWSPRVTVTAGAGQGRDIFPACMGVPPPWLEGEASGGGRGETSLY